MSNETNHQDVTERYMSYEQIPLFLNATEVTKVLGISLSNVYEVMRGADFPIIVVGGRRLVRKEKLFEWLEKHEVKNVCSQPVKKTTSSTF